MTVFAFLLLMSAPADRALDEQDRTALEKIAGASIAAAAKKPSDFPGQLDAALKQSMLAQLAIELGDKAMGRQAAEAGMVPARKAIELKPNDSEAHRLLGTAVWPGDPRQSDVGIEVRTLRDG
jgi:hypothetical protein